MSHIQKPIYTCSTVDLKSTVQDKVNNTILLLKDLTAAR